MLRILFAGGLVFGVGAGAALAQSGFDPALAAAGLDNVVVVNAQPARG